MAAWIVQRWITRLGNFAKDINGWVRRKWNVVRPALLAAVSLAALIGLSVGGVVRNVSLAAIVVMLAYFAAKVIRALALHAKSRKTEADQK